MTETYYAGSYWHGRKESAEACARRAEVFFNLLARCDPTFGRWYGLANSRDEALRMQLVPDAATFSRIFGKQDQRYEDGYFVGAWNGENSEADSGIVLSCGSSSPRVTNACVLNPPVSGPVSERLLTAPVLGQILRAMVQAWEPEWAIATSGEHRDASMEFADPGTFVGWVMYFAHRRGRVPPLPEPVRVEPVADLGTLVTLTPERFTAANPGHVALATRVHELLAQAGLLRPLQAWSAP